jgi:hypothetical protein
MFKVGDRVYDRSNRTKGIVVKVRTTRWGSERLELRPLPGGQTKFKRTWEQLSTYCQLSPIKNVRGLLTQQLGRGEELDLTSIKRTKNTKAPVEEGFSRGLQARLDEVTLYGRTSQHTDDTTSST